MRKSASWAPAPNLKVLAVERNETDWIVAVDGLDHATCPLCGIQSISRHSSYRRTLQDLSAQGKPVSVRARMTRWRCRNDRCERRIFAERLPALTAPFARRTARLAGIVRLFSHGAGRRPSERLMTRLGMPVSDTTILRDLKRSARSHPYPVHVRVAGIDDWAWRKGMTYGTVIVDLERRRVVDLLPDHSAASTATWLKAHPEVEIVSRDRAGLYAEGAREGSPQALQVADLHLLQNFRETVERQLGQFGAPIREAPIGEALQEGGVLAATDEPAPLQPAPQRLVKRCKGSDALEYHKAGRLARRANRQVLFDKIRELYDAGKTVAAIARVVGFGRKSVARWVRLLVLPPRNSMMPKRQSTPAYHEAFLLRRWAEGITNGRRLFGEILQRGYSGSYSHLARLLAPWREAAIAPKLSKSGAPMTLNSAKLPVPVFNQPPASTSTPTLDLTAGRKISPLTAAALCVKPRGQMTPQQIASVDALKIATAEFTIMRQLAMRFRGLLMGSSIEKLDVWLQDAQLSGVYAMHRFARAVRQDIDAVRNAVLEPWSNGQTEGQINRLKTIKRAMYGRAGIELLRARMIPL